MISAVILTRNEQENITRCLKSVDFCEEIVVVDDFSTDNTVGLVEGFGKSRGKIKIFRRKLEGDLASQHNFGLSKARGNWVLFVDADEVVSLDLQEEIQKKCDREKRYSGYLVQRIDYFWGQKLQHGETGSIKLLRLAKKSAGKWERRVHEIWNASGEIGRLENPLYHFSHPGIGEFIESVNRWTDIDARELPKEGKKFSFIATLVNPFGKFMQNYFLRLGFLDGFAGFVMAFMMSLYSLTVRVKMYEQLVLSPSKHGLSQSS